MEIINIISYAILAPCITLFLYTIIGSPKVFEDIREANGLPFVEINESMIFDWFGRIVAKYNKTVLSVFLCPYCLNFWIALFVGIFAACNNHISYISVVAIIALSQQLIKYAK